VQALFVAFMAIFNVVSLIKAQIEENITKKDAYFAIIMKIILNLFHVLNFILLLDIPWPTLMAPLISSPAIVATAPLQVFTFNCYYKYPPFTWLSMRPFYTKLFILAVAPFPLTIIASICFLVSFLLKYGVDFFDSKKHIKNLQNYCVASFIILVYNLQPTFLIEGLKAVDCSLNLGDGESEELADRYLR
jgi:hypothetical protein